MTKTRLELADCIEFENILQNRIQELKESNNLRESDVLINEIDTLENILGRLLDVKYGDKTRAIEIGEADHNFKQGCLRKQLNKIQGPS